MEIFSSYNSSSLNTVFLLNMKMNALRTLAGATLAALLAACGANSTSEQPTQTAALVETVNGTAQPIVTASTATMPAPDCADQGCKGLRVIDANAEAYRYDAMRRAAAESAPQS
jgi:hypothetical protein